ncbi:recombinase family protein [Microbacterium hominis]|uniref:recombinase family protein n=1 Tax=Microbacterium hominis TaxID=162426 RepID=UPI000768697E|nr:recombinase family protein [Microbacterium hominis]KXC06430.1 recombinase [Microbacterium hominis]
MTVMLAYLRVSTDQQADSGLGIEAQRDTIQRYADAHGWEVEWYVDAGLSGKSLDRPQLQAALDRLNAPAKRRDADGLLVSKLDRLSRSLADFADLLERARARQWSLVAIDLGVDTSTPTGEMVANVMMAVSQWERRTIGQRTSDAMQAAKRQGRHMGRHSTLPQNTADRLLELRATRTLAATADALNAEGHTTATGTSWDEHKVCKTQHRLARDATAARLREALAA